MPIEVQVFDEIVSVNLTMDEWSLIHDACVEMEMTMREFMEYCTMQLARNLLADNLTVR